MFDGISDQFHQFIASRASHPISLSFPPLHGSATNFTTFDPYPPPSHQAILQPHHYLPQQLHCQSDTTKDEGNKQETSSYLELELQRQTSMAEPITNDPWSNEEVLALLRIRSSMEKYWFADFTWEHASRKLGELGFKRSAENCKEKFEEENRLLNNINFSKNYRCFSELEELYLGDNPQTSAGEKNQSTEKQNEEEDNMGKNIIEEEDSRVQEINDVQEVGKSTRNNKKTKGKQKFEILKSVCLDIVNMMMAQQEELHNKIIENVIRRDEDKIAREEEWKKQEMERINKEIEIRRSEQAIAGDRQATIIEFLQKLTSSSSMNSLPSLISESCLKYPTWELTNQNKVETATSSSNREGGNYLNNPISLPSQNSIEKSTAQNPSCTPLTETHTTPSSLGLADHHQNPNPTNSNTENNPPLINATSSEQNERPESSHQSDLSDQRVDANIGKRWPRNEVMALINLRCSLNKNVEDQKQQVEGGNKVPLWERISQGMSELGYNRTAKRCKQKWENINKYFRKTKNINKKRSLDSRTCPYFHQLSCLYSQGTLAAQAGPENHSNSLPQNH